MLRLSEVMGESKAIDDASNDEDANSELVELCDYLS